MAIEFGGTKHLGESQAGVIDHQYEPGMKIANEIFFVDAVAGGKGIAAEKDIDHQCPANVATLLTGSYRPFRSSYSVKWESLK